MSNPNSHARRPNTINRNVTHSVIILLLIHTFAICVAEEGAPQGVIQQTSSATTEEVNSDDRVVSATDKSLQIAARALALFEETDNDNSGMLDRDEFTLSWGVGGGDPATWFNYDLLDSNHDGLATKEEWSALLQRRTTDVASRVSISQDAASTDVLTRLEKVILKVLHPASLEQSRALFNRLDADKSGSLSEGELTGVEVRLLEIKCKHFLPFGPSSCEAIPRATWDAFFIRYFNHMLTHQGERVVAEHLSWLSKGAEVNQAKRHKEQQMKKPTKKQSPPYADNLGVPNNGTLSETILAFRTELICFLLLLSLVLCCTHSTIEFTPPQWWRQWRQVCSQKPKQVKHEQSKNTPNQKDATLPEEAETKEETKEETEVQAAMEAAMEAAEEQQQREAEGDRTFGLSSMRVSIGLEPLVLEQTQESKQITGTNKVLKYATAPEITDSQLEESAVKRESTLQDTNLSKSKNPWMDSSRMADLRESQKVKPPEPKTNPWTQSRIRGSPSSILGLTEQLYTDATSEHIPKNRSVVTPKERNPKVLKERTPKERSCYMFTVGQCKKGDECPYVHAEKPLSHLCEAAISNCTPEQRAAKSLLTSRLSSGRSIVTRQAKQGLRS